MTAESNSINGPPPSSDLAKSKPSIQYPDAATSNHISLSALDRETAKDRLSSAEKELVVLKADIARLSLLKSQLTGKKKEIEHLKVALAPHKDLPNDVLSEIFSYFVDDVYCLRLPRSSIIDGPWALLQICARWRRVALSCRSLWHSVHVDTKLPTWCHMDRFKTFDVDFAQLWRSKLFCARLVLPQHGPIRLSFRIFARTATLENQLALDALHLLVLPNASRIEQLNLDASLATSKPFLHTFRTANLDSLIKVSLDSSYGTRHQGFEALPVEFINPFSFLGDAPRLSNLSVSRLADMSFAFPRHEHTQIWSQLTELTICGGPDLYSITTMDIFPCLSHCLNLTSLRIEEVLFEADSELAIDAVTLPKLEHLKLVVLDNEDEDLDYQYSAMNLLTLPSLVTLTVSEQNGNGACPLETLTDLIRRSHCSETLTYINNSREYYYDYGYDSEDDEEFLDWIPQYSYSQLKELAELIPAVQDLTLALRMDLQEHIEPLAREGLLPNLVTLSIWFNSSCAQSPAKQLDTLVRKSKQEGKWIHLEKVVMLTSDNNGVFRDGGDDGGAECEKESGLEGDITVVRWPAYCHALVHVE